MYTESRSITLLSWALYSWQLSEDRALFSHWDSSHVTLPTITTKQPLVGGTTGAEPACVPALAPASAFTSSSCVVGKKNI